MRPRRVLLIGLDALTPKLVDRWTESGELVTLARLRAEGAWGTLQSVPNRNSAPSWSTIMTGLNPGKHGIFWFTQDDPVDYSYRFVNGGDRDGDTLWSTLFRQGKRVGSVNVPMSFPADEVDGFVVAGLDCPSVKVDGFTYPAELADEIASVTSGDYEIHSGVGSFANPATREGALDRLHRSIDARAAATRHLMATRPWDFLTVVFTESDVIQHFFWRQMEAPRPEDPPHHRTAILDVYKHLDQVVGELIGDVDEDTLVVLVSDHGARADDGLARALPGWLAQLGFLSYRSRKPHVSLVSGVYRFIEKNLSTNAKHRLSGLFPGLRQRAEVALSYSGFDWANTQAYTDGKRPEIWINLEGRQVHGSVAADRYQQVRDEIVDALTSARCAATGDPVVAAVHKREDVYTGPYADRSPDLVLEWAELGACSVVEYPDGRRISLATQANSDDPVEQALNGGHAKFGVIGLWGPGTQRVPLTAHVTDVAPTVLHALRAAMSREVDGRVLTEALDPELAGAPVRYYDPASSDDDGSRGYSEEEEAQVRERLQALGYVE